MTAPIVILKIWLWRTYKWSTIKIHFNKVQRVEYSRCHLDAYVHCSTVDDLVEEIIVIHGGTKLSHFYQTYRDASV